MKNAYNGNEGGIKQEALKFDSMKIKLFRILCLVTVIGFCSLANAQSAISARWSDHLGYNSDWVPESFREFEIEERLLALDIIFVTESPLPRQLTEVQERVRLTALYQQTRTGMDNGRENVLLVPEPSCLGLTATAAIFWVLARCRKLTD